MTNELHVIEPTLETDAGHCHSFIASFCGAWARKGRAFPISVWAGSRARLPGLEETGIDVHPYFHRRIRRLQQYFLFASLMRKPGRIFIPTGGRTDLILLDRAAGKKIPAGKAYLYAHWIRPTAAKEKGLRRLAARQPNIVILAPTASVGRFYSRCGFGHTKIVPYPITPRTEALHDSSTGFRHLLFAGAARKDKGFTEIVELVAFMARIGSDIPVVLQISADHYNRHDRETKSALSRLHSISYPFLRMVGDTLRPDEFTDLFRDAICLQPYRREDFADRISGVTLDAMSAGCPVIATAGTWMSSVVNRFDAGKEVDDLSPDSLMAAVGGIRSGYERYRNNAAGAGRVLQEENSGEHLLSIFSGSG